MKKTERNKNLNEMDMNEGWNTMHVMTICTLSMQCKLWLQNQSTYAYGDEDYREYTTSM